MKSTSVDVNTNSNEQDGDKAEVDDSMNEDGCATCLHIPELDDSPSSRNLK